MRSALPQDWPASRKMLVFFPSQEGVLLRSIIVALGTVVLVGCGQPSEITLSDAWVRMPAAPGRPGAGYVTITGGATDQTLVAVSTPAAKRVELHETMAHGRGMTMLPLEAVPIPAGVPVKFAPGGKHLMLFDIAPAAAGKPFPMTFTFANGRTVTVEARAIAAGDAAPVE